MRPTICEIMYEMKGGQLVEVAREVVCPEHIRWAGDEPYMRMDTGLVPLRPLIEQKPPKFAQIALGEGRSMNELPEALRQAGRRDVIVSNALCVWLQGGASLLSVLRSIAWLLWEWIESAASKYPNLAPESAQWDQGGQLDEWIPHVLQAFSVRSGMIGRFVVAS